MKIRPLHTAAVAIAATAAVTSLLAAGPTAHELVHERKTADRATAQPVLAEPVVGETVSCVDGFAGQFPCHAVDLLAWLTPDLIGGGDLNDIWGWADEETGQEYALVGKSSGMAIVDITDPGAPIYLGDVATQTLSSSWRDVKVHDDTAYIVSEAPAHGIQSFDLTLLRGATTRQDWPATNWQIPTGSVHNVAINNASGRAYAVGSELCDGGPYVIDLDGFSPIARDGCVDLDGYTHDIQCVTYDGPDTDHSGAEICLASNTDTVTIWDLTDPAAPEMLSRTPYADHGYTHQGWLTEDHAYFLVGDELDEQRFAVPTTTLVFDVRDLDAPFLVGRHEHRTAAIDHNMYVTGDLVHQANYRAGYRLLELTDLARAHLTELAWFDVYPADDNPSFNGAWSVYPYLPSGNVIVSGIEQGLFVLRPTVDAWGG